MEFIVNNDCYNLKEIENVNPIIQPFVENVLSKLSVESLDYFVIADSSKEAYKKTVNEYATIIHTNAETTQNNTYEGVGKSLSGLDEKGNLHQAIVIKSACWYKAAFDLLRIEGELSPEYDIDDNTKNISLILILHEIGHTIDNENQYLMFGTINTNICYYLSSKYDEFIKQTALSVWGEYYAESIPFKLISLNSELLTSKEEELIDCIKMYSLGPNINEILDRVYRILYFFVHLIARIDQSSKFNIMFELSKYTDDKQVSKYIPLFERTNNAIANLSQKYPSWDTDSDLDELILVYKDFLNFECLRYE